jgi:hypothetical protein
MAGDDVPNLGKSQRQVSKAWKNLRKNFQALEKMG